MYFKILFLLLAIILVSCVEKASNPPIAGGSSSSGGTTDGAGGTTTTPTPPPTGTTDASGPCDTAGVGDSSYEYYKLPNVITHGSTGGSVQWATNTDSRMSDAGWQNSLMTDSRFNMRIVAYPSPGKGTDSLGNECRYSAVDYKKLKMKVRVRSVEGAVREHTFDNISTNSCSGVHEFMVPPSTSPLIVEVMDIQWDYSCTYYANAGFPNAEGVCPFDYVWPHDCVEFKLQIATDFTKDIPH